MFDDIVTQHIFNDLSCFIRTCPCSSVVNRLGHHVHWSVTRLMSRVQSSVQARLPSTKELFRIIPMHMMNREIIPGRKRGFVSVLYNLTFADSLSSSVKLVSLARVAEAKRQ